MAFFDDTEGDSLYTVFLTDRLLYWNSTLPTDSILVIGSYQESEFDNNETNDIAIANSPDYNVHLRLCLQWPKTLTEISMWYSLQR